MSTRDVKNHIESKKLRLRRSNSRNDRENNRYLHSLLARLNALLFIFKCFIFETVIKNYHKNLEHRVVKVKFTVVCYIQCCSASKTRGGDYRCISWWGVHRPATDAYANGARFDSEWHRGCFFSAQLLHERKVYGS